MTNNAAIKASRASKRFGSLVALDEISLEIATGKNLGVQFQETEPPNLIKARQALELVQAIHAVSRGESWLAPSVATRLIGQMRKQATDALSERELDVLRLVAKGHSNKEIAARMYISQATVKTHLIHIFCKLDVNDRTAAVTVSLERGLISI